MVSGSAIIMHRANSKAIHRDEKVAESLEVLNTGFNSSGAQVTFVLASIDRRVNSTWFGPLTLGTDAEMEMLSSLHQGGVADLNVYSVGYVAQFGKVSEAEH